MRRTRSVRKEAIASARSAQRGFRAVLWFSALTMGALALTRENALVLHPRGRRVDACALQGAQAGRVGPAPRVGRVWRVERVWRAWQVGTRTQNANQNRREPVPKTGRTRTPRTRIAESRTPNPEPRLARAALFLMGLASSWLPLRSGTPTSAGGFYITTVAGRPELLHRQQPERRRHVPVAAVRPRRTGIRAAGRDRARRARARDARSRRPKSRATGPTRRWTSSRREPGAWLTLMARKTALLVNATEVLDTESQETHAEYSCRCGCSASSDTSACSCRWRCSARSCTWPLRRRLCDRLCADRSPTPRASSLFYVFARYRYPLVPMLMLFAAAGITAVSPNGSRLPGAP